MLKKQIDKIPTYLYSIVEGDLMNNKTDVYNSLLPIVEAVLAKRSKHMVSVLTSYQDKQDMKQDLSLKLWEKMESIIAYIKKDTEKHLVNKVIKYVNKLCDSSLNNIMTRYKLEHEAEREFITTATVEDYSTDDIVHSLDTKEEIHNAMVNLTENELYVIDRLYFQESDNNRIGRQYALERFTTYRDIAKELGVSRQTICNWFHSAKEKIKKNLKKQRWGVYSP